MKKNTIKLVVLAMALFANFAGKAQVEFNHSVGGGLYASANSGGGYALVYSPRLNLTELSDELSISVGSHLGAGLEFSSNSRSGSSGSFILDIPVVAELNFGHACSSNSSAGFGGFVGAGFGFNKMSYDNGIFSSDRNATGVVINGGFRTNLIREQSVTLRVSYMLASDGNGDILGLGLTYNIGDFN
jgi:hypothetical protein